VLAVTLSPTEAIDHLKSLAWHMYGGSYFGKKGKKAEKDSLNIL
jgi:hypothetical protein